MAGRSTALLVALVLAVALPVFFNRAAVQGRLVNTDRDSTDQSAYIKQAIEQRTSDFAFVNPRNRMPLFPALLALFMDKAELLTLREEVPERKEFFSRACGEFFETGKKINTVLAAGVLVFLAVVFFRKFPRHHALNIWLLAAFGVLVFKAPFVQAEILYYFLTFAAFLLCWRLFGRPGFLAALLAGILLGLGHLTKASVLPGVVVVAVFYPLDALWRRGRLLRDVTKRFVVAAVVVLAFLAVIFPYIVQSKKMFGHYFYNVNSTFYMWCDSWKEAKSRTGDDDRKSWPDLPADQLPSLGNYLKTHTAGEMTWRVVKGISVVFNSMKRSYGYLWPCVAYLVAAAGVVVAKRRLVWRLVRRRPAPVLALTAYFTGYYVLVAWYSPIINGNRFILGLFLPFLFTVSAVLVTLAPRIRWRFSVSPLTVLNAVMSAWIAVQIAVIGFSRITWMYGGG